MSDQTDSSGTTSADKAAYYLALGYFIQTFAAAEAAMQVMLWKASGISDIRTASALLSGVKIDTAISLISRVRETQGLVAHKRLDYLLQQLGLINKARNMIIHHGAHFSDELGMIVSNLRVAHTPEKIQGFFVSPAILGAMRSDLDTIIHQTLDIAETYDPLAPAQEGELPTWLYKQKILTVGRHKNRDQTPKQKRQRKPSQE